MLGLQVDASMVKMYSFGEPQPQPTEGGDVALRSMTHNMPEAIKQRLQ